MNIQDRSLDIIGRAYWRAINARNPFNPARGKYKLSFGDSLMDEEQVIKQEVFSDSPIMFRLIYNNMKKGEMDLGNFVIFSEDEKFICTIKSMKSTFSGDLELGVVVTGDCEALLQKALEEEAQQTLLAVEALSTDPVSSYQIAYILKDNDICNMVRRNRIGA